MSDYLFLDKTSQPSDDQLKEVLSTSYDYWIEVQNVIEQKYGKFIPEWKFYTKKTGWTRKTMLKKRNLFFFKPFKNYFMLTFVFGDKAVKEIEKSGISAELIKELLSAKKYAEGRALSVKVTQKSDLENIFNLIDIKLNN